ncbi:unnamed protein product [Rotaria magnacalcarata]|uniref:Mediator complex subunit 1 n=1 Tax=Rotaria magnacalcarata TaxID=392030 RepID=A0A816UB01_9BILA|nr:unnamed protein product [Rotaria magnacalcarata]CAF2202857.1 unnamed protein product [Rotaria magnacalcarata]CAF3979983.1 unnamed protein product [Rotaria magnacalcarata]CAF4038226.1 unnamed protein product [Rotaria magnacalcarata]
MASSSIIMLSNVSMERLYLSQPPAWTDLQRLPFSLGQQQQDTRSSQQIIRTCYDKLLHHMYDMNSSSTTTVNQINEQLELAAEYCQLKNFHDGNAVYLHSDQFYLEIKFDSTAHVPQHVSICFTDEQQVNSDSYVCSRMLKALNEKQYKLFREHLNGYANLFTLSAPTMNNDRRIGSTAYKILQQDIERLSKTDGYGTLLEGFEPTCEGLPMRIKFNDKIKTDPLLPNNVRIIIVPSNNQHFLPMKSSIYMDEKTNTIQLDTSLKSNLLATGHFALEFDENQSPFTFLLSYAQEISQLTNINSFISNVKSFNYLSTIIPKTKSFSQYQWYISHDQLAISIRRIPFTNLKQLIRILNLIRQQIYLTKYFNYYFNNDYDHDRMEDDSSNEIYLELSFLSSTILSITCAQSYRLSTFLLQMSNINTLPLLINRQQQKEIYLTNDKCSLLKLIESILKVDNLNKDSFESIMDFKPANQPQEQTNNATNPSKINRRLSCGPPAKPTWRRATTLRRMQPACLTLASIETVEEKIDDEPFIDDDVNQNITTEPFDDDDNDPFPESPDQQSLHHQQILPKPSSNPYPSSLSRCTSVSSTQSISTPPTFGLSPSTPYPGGKNNPNGNIFFPLGKQVSVPEHSPVTSPIIMGAFDPLSFLPTNTASSNPMSSNDPNIKTQKKKRRRSEHSTDDFIQSLNSTSNDNRSPILTTKLTSSGGDQSNIKRGKKPMDKNPQQQQQQQIARPKSAFKVTDSPTTGLISQQSLTSSDETQNELKSLKVVIKRVGDSGSTSNDESQQQIIKQRKKQQQNMANATGTLPTTVRKLPSSNSSGGSSPSVLLKSESIDMSQLNVDINSNTMMTLSDGMQVSRERSRPSSSQLNLSAPLSSSVSSQPRSTAPQPPIVLKIQRSKVYPGQEPSSLNPSSTLSTVTATTPTTNNTPSSLKEASKPRARSIPSGTNTNKQSVTSPPLLAAKLTSPSTATANNPLAPPISVNPSFRIPRKSSSQEVAAKLKVEPIAPASNASPALPKTPLLPTPVVRPPPPPSQIGSWQSPPTQQPSRFHQSRPRSSWSQQQAPRGRAPITPPNVSALNSGHTSLPNFAQQPRSILKKPSSNENPASDSIYMSSSDLPGLNEQRAGANFAAPPPPPSRTSTSPGMYDDNDDDSSPQAQLVIDTSSNTTNNVLLPYTIVPGSTSGAMDSFDQQHENNTMMNSSQQQHIVDDSLSNID